MPYWCASVVSISGMAVEGPSHFSIHNWTQPKMTSEAIFLLPKMTSEVIFLLLTSCSSEARKMQGNGIVSMAIYAYISGEIFYH